MQISILIGKKCVTDCNKNGWFWFYSYIKKNFELQLKEYRSLWSEVFLKSGGRQEEVIVYCTLRETIILILSSAQIARHEEKITPD